MWAGYRFVALADAQATSNLKVIDLGAGHASASETLCGRIVASLKSEALLNESVGAGYIDRHWPPALKKTGAWALTSLRQSFLNGALTRLIDPDAVLRQKIVEFVASGYFGLASGTRDDGGYERLWFAEPVGPEEVAFEASVFLLIKERAKKLREIPQQDGDQPKPEPPPPPGPAPTSKPGPDPGSVRDAPKTTLRLTGTVPPETWNRFGTKVIPKLHDVDRLVVEINFTIDLATPTAALVEAELKQNFERSWAGRSRPHRATIASAACESTHRNAKAMIDLMQDVDDVPRRTAIGRRSGCERTYCVARKWSHVTLRSRTAKEKWSNMSSVESSC